MGVKLSHYQIEVMCKEIMEILWNETINIPIRFSNKMTRTLGELRTTHSFKPIDLIFSNKIINGDYKIETIEEILKHELCHYYICKIGGNFHDGSPQFENELKRIGAHSTKTIHLIGEIHIGVCSECGKVVVNGTERKVKNKCIPRYRSSCCKALINYKGVEYRNDNTKPSTNFQYTSNLAKKIAAMSKNELNNIETIKKEVKSEIKIENKLENSNLDINSIVKPGSKGVTRAQVHPAIISAIQENSKEKLMLIKETYTEHFNSAITYMSKKNQEYLKRLELI